MRIAGVDPGSKGAICVLDTINSAAGALIDLDKSTVYDIYTSLVKLQPDEIWVEDVHSLYGMSAKSNFNFGRNLGMISTVAEIVMGTPPNIVTPKIWQKAVGVTAKGKAIKNEVASIVQSIYPSANIYGKKGGLLDGRSDAIMIAHYGILQRMSHEN